jgi:glycerol-3-phosphate dehydrogenase
LPGGDFPIDGAAALQADLRARYPFLAEADADRMAKAYGTRALRWLGEAQAWADLGRGFGGGLSETEVEYLRGQEWARTAGDVLWRRSKLGLRLSAQQQAELERYLAESPV